MLALSRTDDASVRRLADWVRGMLAEQRGGRHVPVDPGPMAPHGHGHDLGHTHDEPPSRPDVLSHSH